MLAQQLARVTDSFARNEPRYSSSAPCLVVVTSALNSSPCCPLPKPWLDGPSSPAGDGAQLCGGRPRRHLFKDLNTISPLQRGAKTAALPVRAAAPSLSSSAVRGGNRPATVLLLNKEGTLQRTTDPPPHAPHHPAPFPPLVYCLDD